GLINSSEIELIALQYSISEFVGTAVHIGGHYDMVTRRACHQGRCNRRHSRVECETILSALEPFELLLQFLPVRITVPNIKVRLFIIKTWTYECCRIIKRLIGSVIFPAPFIVYDHVCFN